MFQYAFCLITFLSFGKVVEDQVGELMAKFT